MSHEELAILNFLRGSPESYFTRKEISRKAIRRQEFEENQQWANAPLASLVGQGALEVNESGHYRIKKSTFKL